MIQSMLRSLRSSRMISSVISALLSQTLDWLPFIGGHISKDVMSQVRSSAFIEPKSHDAHQSAQRESESESESDQCEIKLKDNCDQI
eukprot:3298357-Amphidinium_carterae.1